MHDYQRDPGGGLLLTNASRNLIGARSPSTTIRPETVHQLWTPQQPPWRSCSGPAMIRPSVQMPEMEAPQWEAMLPAAALLIAAETHYRHSDGIRPVWSVRIEVTRVQVEGVVLVEVAIWVDTVTMSWAWAHLRYPVMTWQAPHRHLPLIPACRHNFLPITDPVSVTTLIMPLTQPILYEVSVVIKTK